MAVKAQENFRCCFQLQCSSSIASLKIICLSTYKTGLVLTRGSLPSTGDNSVLSLPLHRLIEKYFSAL